MRLLLKSVCSNEFALFICGIRIIPTILLEIQESQQSGVFSANILRLAVGATDELGFVHMWCFCTSDFSLFPFPCSVCSDSMTENAIRLLGALKYYCSVTSFTRHWEREISQYIFAVNCTTSKLWILREGLQLLEPWHTIVSSLISVIYWVIKKNPHSCTQWLDGSECLA